MDIVKFDIVLSRHPPRRSPTPLPSSAPATTQISTSSATVPNLGEVSDSQAANGNKNGATSPSPSERSSVGDLKVPAVVSSGIISPVHFGPSSITPTPTTLKLPTTGTISQPSSHLGDRFHDWMEMDLEHGL